MIRFVARRKIFSDAKQVEVLTSSGWLFERPKSFSMSAIEREFSQKQNLSIQKMYSRRSSFYGLLNVPWKAVMRMRKILALSLFRCL
jgi:hypothetical protein